MIGWIAVLTAVILLVVLLQLRVGALVVYSESGVEVRLRIAGKYILLVPKPKKTRSQLARDKEKAERKKLKKQLKAEKKALKEQKKAEKKAEKPDTQEEKKKGGSIELVLALLPVVVRALGALRRKIRIAPLEIHFVAGCMDAADTALLYAKSAGGAGILLPLLEENFDVKEREVTVDMDFLAGHSTVYIRAGLSFKVGQLLYIALRYGLACLKVFLKKKKEQKKKVAQRKVEGEKKKPAEASNHSGPAADDGKSASDR